MLLATSFICKLLGDILPDNFYLPSLGYSIASKIEKVFGIEELRNCVGNPLQFLVKYEEALYQSSHEGIFDEELIERLEEIYE